MKFTIGTDINYKPSNIGELIHPKLSLKKKLKEYIKYQKSAKQEIKQAIEKFSKEKTIELDGYIKALFDIETWINEGSPINQFTFLEKED